MWPWPLTLWPWPWPLTLNICSVTNLNAIEQSAVELLRFQCSTVWPWTCFKSCARLWNNFHQVWPSTTYACLNSSVFLMPIRCVTLWPWSLTRWPWSSWYMKRHVIKVCTKFERYRAILGWIIDDFANFCTRYVSRCDLDLWPLDLKLLRHFGCHAFKLTKFARNLIIHGWVVDDLERFCLRLVTLLVGYVVGDRAFSARSAWTQLFETWPVHKAIIAASHFCFKIRIYCCIFKRGQLKDEWFFKRRQISHFLTPLW